MASIRVKGNLLKTRRALNRMLNSRELVQQTLERYGQIGVDALEKATPVRTGKTASSWYYEIENEGGRYTISWNNSNVNNHVNIAVIIQTGHGTGTGGYVRGKEYIEPALRPVFESIADAVWKEVTG